jgi:Tol biopolymer transport system component
VFLPQDDFPVTREFDDFLNVGEASRLAVVTGTGDESWTNRNTLALDNSGQPRKVNRSGEIGLSPDWAVDGRLAYVAQPDMGHLAPYEYADALYLTRDLVYTGRDQRRIWIVDSDGASAERMTDEGSPEERPLWSNRGDHILFVVPGSESLLQPATLRLYNFDRGSSDRVATIDVAIDVTGDYNYAPDIIPIDRFGHRNWEAVFDWWQPPLN